MIAPVTNTAIKNTYKTISKTYKANHNKAMSRLHNIKFIKNQNMLIDSIEKFEDKVCKSKTPFFEFDAFENVLLNMFKTAKEKFLSVYYLNKYPKQI